MTEAKEIAGQGVKAKVDGHWVLAGNKKLMDAENVNMYQNGEGDGKFGTVVYIAVDGKFRGTWSSPTRSSPPPSRPSSS